MSKQISGDLKERVIASHKRADGYKTISKQLCLNGAPDCLQMPASECPRKIAQNTRQMYWVFAKYSVYPFHLKAL